MHSFFQFRAHGTTPRIVMMMASATSSSSLASSRALLRRRRATALRHVMLFWKCRRCGEPTSPSVPSDALHRIAPRHPTRPRKMCDANGTRKSYTMFALHERRWVHPRARKANEKIERLHSEDALYVREPSGNISAPSLLCFPPLSHIFHHATPSSARISTRPLTRRSFLSSHPPSF